MKCYSPLPRREGKPKYSSRPPAGRKRGTARSGAERRRRVQPFFSPERYRSIKKEYSFNRRRAVR